MQDYSIVLGNPLEYFRAFLAIGVLLSFFSGFALFYLRNPARFAAIPILLGLILLFAQSSFFVYTIIWADLTNNWTQLLGPGMIFILMGVVFGMGCFVGYTAKHSDVARLKFLGRY